MRVVGTRSALVCRNAGSRLSLYTAAHRLSIKEIQTALKEEKQSVTEICAAWLKQLHQTEDKINSFLYVDEECVMQQVHYRN